MSVPTHNTQPIAIIGMECRLPGADSVDAFWSNIRHGVSSLGPVSEERLNRALYYNPTVGIVNRTYTDLGGIIEYRPVDRNVCPITDEWENQYDVAHLNLCEVASRACLNARIDPRHFPVRHTGVYVGSTTSGAMGSEMVVATNLPETLKTFENIVPENLRGQKLSEHFNHLIKKISTKTRQRQFDGSPFTGANCAASLIAQVL
ncbi:MAG: hypothetical protein LBQ50_03295, partial [Planctomycetaceae bacterium]|nr:hypothetical protein [Planctomycetaceae bacterium]